MRIKLTPAFVTGATAALNAERTTYWDAAQPGFGLMVTRNGHTSCSIVLAGARSACTSKPG